MEHKGDPLWVLGPTPLTKPPPPPLQSVAGNRKDGRGREEKSNEEAEEWRERVRYLKKKKGGRVCFAELRGSSDDL